MRGEGIPDLEFIIHTEEPNVILQVLRPSSEEQYHAAMKKIKRTLVWHAVIPEDRVILYFVTSNGGRTLTQENYKDIASELLGIILQSAEWWREYGRN